MCIFLIRSEWKNINLQDIRLELLFLGKVLQSQLLRKTLAPSKIQGKQCIPPSAQPKQMLVMSMKPNFETIATLKFRWRPISASCSCEMKLLWFRFGCSHSTGSWWLSLGSLQWTLVIVQMQRDSPVISSE